MPLRSVQIACARLVPVLHTRGPRGTGYRRCGASRHGSRHYIPPNLDIKVTFKVIQDSVLGVVNYCYTIIVS